MSRLGQHLKQSNRRLMSPRRRGQSRNSFCSRDNVILGMVTLLALGLIVHMSTVWTFTMDMSGGGGAVTPVDSASGGVGAVNDNKNNNNNNNNNNKQSTIQDPKASPNIRGKNANNPTEFPPLPSNPYPALTAGGNEPVDITEWKRWAISPDTGSFQFLEPGTVLHYPAMDMQTYFKNHVPDFRRVDNALVPKSTQGMMFPSPDCAILTRKGNKMAQTGVSANQDRVAIVHFNGDTGGSGGDGQSNVDTGDWWMGLLDGHGTLGHVVSQFGIYEFPKRMFELRRQINSKTFSDAITKTNEIKSAVSQMFLDINSILPRTDGGSTAISIWKHGKQLFISNLGDSKAFVVSVKKWMDGHKIDIVYETKPHKPDDPVEQKRIQEAGGRIQLPPQPGYSARLLIPLGNNPNDPFDVMALAMSRCFGDFEGAKYGLIAEPHTDVIDLTGLDPKLDYLVILASDGLLDRVKEMDVAQKMAASKLLDDNGKFLPLEVAEQLILQSSEMWMIDVLGQGYRDDISLAVHRLRLS